MPRRISDDQQSIQSDTITISSDIDPHAVPLLTSLEKQIPGNMRSQQRRSIQRGCMNMTDDLKLMNKQAEAQEKAMII